ncbi:NPXTG-anchored protein [Ruminococcus sp.]|uniref:NPXTG-anchored protein n=1 Tax=Ruminococcus sp. TaxID=41978 RepID=UPI0025DDA08B|nr:NPXTG-anchored protein [Ruminococcus sp.]MBQ9543470.1 NPXTG-anchored protein [Ruminococcus sp.]
MKKRISAFVISFALLVGGALTASAESAAESEKGGEKAVVTAQENPNTGAVTLGTVSVALAGCVVLVCKKRK